MDEGAIELSKNKYEIDMCNGTIMDKLVSFAIPLMVSGILQLMFNAVDIIVVGRFSGSQALAAVGSTTALINVFTNLLLVFHWELMYWLPGSMRQVRRRRCRKRYIRLLHWLWSVVWRWLL